MPIYEYRCGRCGADFELLVGPAPGGARSTKKVACPECTSPKVTRKFSAFAVRSSSGHGRSSCAGCGGGHCGSCH